MRNIEGRLNGGRVLLFVLAMILSPWCFGSRLYWGTTASSNAEPANSTHGGCVGEPCSGSIQVANFANLTLSYAGNSSAAYGRFGMAVDASLSGNATPTGLQPVTAAGSFAGAEDLVTILGAPNGTAGNLRLHYAITGTSAATAGARAGLSYYFAVNDVPFYGGSLNNNGGVVSVDSGPLPFMFGTPFKLTTDFFAMVRFDSYAVGVGGSADYLHTALLDGVSVRNVDDQLVAFTMTGDSGVEYGANGVIPEPGTIGLMGVGLVVLLVLRRRPHPVFACKKRLR